MFEEAETMLEARQRADQRDRLGAELAARLRGGS